MRNFQYIVIKCDINKQENMVQDTKSNTDDTNSDYISSVLGDTRGFDRAIVYAMEQCRC